MDPQRLRNAYQRIQSLDERLTYKVRPRPGGAMTRPTTEQMEQSMRDLATYTVELKEIVEELILAIGSKPPGAPTPG